jgi:glucose/arabinose dehydrogenase
MARKCKILFAILVVPLLALTLASCGQKQAAPPQSAPESPQTQAQAQAAPAVNNTDLPLSLPDGFSISIYASNLGSPRAIAWDPNGVMLVSLTQAGKVVALPDGNGDGVADQQVTVAAGLNLPHGMAFRANGGSYQLYIAETDQVAVYDYDAGNLKATNKRKIIDLPGGGVHFTRTIMFRPPPDDNQLLISVGSDANVAIESDWRRAAILVADADGSNFRPFAAGLRNSVFMAVNPSTGAVWATENGRDLLGDDIPPDEINIIEDGNNYGWPNFYGKNVHDTTFDKKTYSGDPAAGMTPSYIDIQAHSAPLGLSFFPLQGWPDAYAHDLLVCYHGSWNRTVPTGYKVVLFHLDENGNYLGNEDFISGWLRPDGNVVGRPVDVSIRDDGTMYITDDLAGLVYLVKKL